MTSKQQFPSQKVVHTLTNIQAYPFLFVFVFIPLDQDKDMFVKKKKKMFPIRLLEKEYQLLVASHRHQVWIV